jgi:hypothetical protein
MRLEDLLLLLLRLSKLHGALIVLKEYCRVQVLFKLVLVLAMHDDFVLRLSDFLGRLLHIVHVRKVVMLGCCSGIYHIMRISMLPLTTLRGS